MASDEIDSETKGQLHSLLVDVWEGIATIWPAYRDAELPVLDFFTEERAEQEDMSKNPHYTSPDFSGIDGAIIWLPKQYCQKGIDFMGEPYEEEVPHSIIDEDCGVAPTLAHESTHHLQYLRGEGGLGSRHDFHDFDPAEDEARFMGVALFWDFKCGQRWRYLDSLDEDPELYDSHSTWFEKLYNQAKARRMLWERLEISLAECVECRESQRPPETDKKPKALDT